MKVRSMLFLVIAVLLSSALLPLNAFAAERPSSAIKQEIQADIGMPVLAGDLWQNMTHDDKIAFVWGFWHAVTMERYFMDRYPQLQVENFSAKVVEASRKSPKTADQIVSLIDQYYKAHPNEIRKPVIGVLWDEMFKPNLETGVAGRPLRQQLRGDLR